MMGREKKAVPGVASGSHAKERHRKDRKAGENKVVPRVPSGNHAKERHRRDGRPVFCDWSGPVPEGLVAKPDIAQPKSKHHSYFEFVENKDKKKKLEFQVTTKMEPPPGFEFVPMGNPALTTACKELSREQDAMIFIVSTARRDDVRDLTLAMNRVGHHIRRTIVEQARASLGDWEYIPGAACIGNPEPIPVDQDEINRQADAAIRDLFPRIPNGDRQAIIQRSFLKGATMKGFPRVGLAPELTLSRRVQLAVLAHIRHTHTRYDQLLRETSYVNARKVVEPLCLEILVKWRGDEETGRDQLDEILREVVVISDSEDEVEGEDDDDELEDSDFSENSGARSLSTTSSVNMTLAPAMLQRPPERNAAAKAQRRFQRYQAVRDQAWQRSVERQRLDSHQPLSPAAPMAMERIENHVSQMRHVPGTDFGPPGSSYAMSQKGNYQVRHSYYGSPTYHTNAQRHDDVPFAYAGTSTATPQLPQHHHTEGQSSGIDRFEPLVGSRATADHPPSAFPPAVSHQAKGIGNYSVRSIEPTTPNAAHFQFQSSNSDHVQGYHYPGHFPSKSALPTTGQAFRAGPAETGIEESFQVRRLPEDPRRAIRVHSAYETRVPAAPIGVNDPRPTPPVAQESHPVRSIFTASDTYNRQLPFTLPWSQFFSGDSNPVRQTSRPISTENYSPRHGAALGSESRPILIDDSPRQYRGGAFGEASRTIVIADDLPKMAQEGMGSRRPYKYSPIRGRITEEPDITTARRDQIGGYIQRHGDSRDVRHDDQYPRAREPDIIVAQQPRGGHLHRHDAFRTVPHGNEYAIAEEPDVITIRRSQTAHFQRHNDSRTIPHDNQYPRAEEPEIITIRRPQAGQLQSHNEPRTAPHDDRYTRAGNVGGSMDIDFISVSNIFPRPHEPRPRPLAPTSGRRDDVWSPSETRSKGPEPGPTYDGLVYRPHQDPQNVQQSFDARTNLPRQERVVRLEYVDHSYPDIRHGPRSHPHPPDQSNGDIECYYPAHPQGVPREG